MNITKKMLIDGYQIAVFNNLLSFPQLEENVKFLYNAPFKKTEFSRAETSQYTHWAHEIEPKNLKIENYWASTAKAVKSIFPDDKWKAYRAYVNYGGFGDAMFSHHDSTVKEITCLWYMVPQWHIDWGGETVFYDKNEEIALACVPKPGRLVVFDGRIKHSGRPPNRNCLHSRFTLAIKLEKLK
jgi:SM-20-related protein